MKRFISRVGRQFRYGDKGFTLIELLVVIAILGIIAAVVVLSVGVFSGRGKEDAANTEAHQVQTAVGAYIVAGGNTTDGTVGPTSNMPASANSTEESVHKHLLNPGLLQASYNITNGVIVDAGLITGSKWEGCTWNTPNGMWQCP